MRYIDEEMEELALIRWSLSLCVRLNTCINTASRIACLDIIIVARDSSLCAYHEDWRPRIRRWRRRGHPTHSTPREILTDPRRCSIIAIIGRFTDSVRLPWKLSAHITLWRKRNLRRRAKGQPWGGGPGFRTHLLPWLLYRGAALNYTLTWRDVCATRPRGSLFRLSFSAGPEDRQNRDERWAADSFWRISREPDGNAGRIQPAIAMERPYVRRSAHYTPLALLYYKVVSEWETKPRPLPAQPYILVLWATHIGRYAIKHSPSARARERASRAERL